MVSTLLGGERQTRKVALPVTVGLILATSVLGVCPPGWVPYRDDLCFYLSTAPALSWNEAHVFCQDQKAQLVVIKDYKKQMFLTDLAEGATGRAPHYWIGLAWQEARGLLAWVDGTPISQSWYRNWLSGHPKKKQCVQLVSIYTGQWRDWDCDAKSRFLCEMQVKDAFPGFVKKAHFRSRCYAFHFPSFREWRSWREARSLCWESGESLATVHDEEENAFLSDAFPEEGWHMWIGLRFGTAWSWSDTSSLAYARWHPETPPSTARDQCVVLILQPADPAQHGRWKTRPCDIRPAGEITGFVCQGREDFCGPPEPVHLPLPGGMGPHATADVAFSLSVRSVCSLSLTGLRAETNTSATLFWLSLESNSTHVHSSIASELGGFPVRKVFPGVPVVPGISTWGFVTYPDGFATFFNQQEHFRLSEVPGISFAGLSSLQISGATVLNASLEHRLSSQVHFPGGRGMKLEEAVRRYLGNFTVGLWLRSLSAGHPKMCVVSYALKWKPPEFALFLLSPWGLEFHLKGAVMFRETRGALLDGSWHHVAISVSTAPNPLPVQVFVDGEPWDPSSAGGGRRSWKKGLPLGGTLCVGQLEIDGRGASFYEGDLSEVNLWDRALSWYSVKQLAASRTKWKHPGNVVSWAQLVAAPSLPLQISTSLSDDPEAAFVWFGSLRLRGKPSVLCSDPEQALVYVAPTQAQCPRGVFWGLQLNGRLRTVGDPPSCLLVAPDGVSLLSGSRCSSDAKNSFRLLPDQRLQNLHSGLCLFQDIRSARLFLGKCTSQALHFVLDWEVYCPQSLAWRSWKDTCLFLVLDAALEWSQALTFCQRFHGGSLVTLRGPQDLAWLQEELQVSVWTGLRSSGGDLWSWADGAPFNPVLRRFMSSWGTPRTMTCMVALPSGFLKAEPCHRPHRWICQVPHQTDSYMTFPGKSFYGALSVDLSFRSLRVARRQCSALGRSCSGVLSTAAGHRLSLGTRFVTLRGSAADPAATGAAVHVKMRCSPGYSGQDCQSMCPPCEPRLSCNPLSGLCEGLLQDGPAPAATVSSLKCLPLGVWVFERGVCLSAERYGEREEAASACQRYLGATVTKIRPPLGQAPEGFAGPQASGVEPDGFLWACQRAEDVELPYFQEKLLISLLGPTPHQRHRSLPEAQGACYLEEERCTGILTLNRAHYTVGGTVLVDSPSSGAVLYVKAACSPGFCGDRCQRRCSPCLSTQVYNPLTGRCDGLLRCLRRFSPSCAHGLVHSRCPQQPGWWFWGGHCYYLEEHSAKDWRGAQAACKAHGKEMDLLTLSSSREKGWVTAVVQRSSWTGLNDVDQDGTWTWASGQPAELSSPWLAGIQLPTGGCLEIGRPKGRDLAASPCSELKAWVCEGPWAPWSPCPTERGWSHWNGSCYFWDPLLSVGSWTDALRACRRFKGTELLSLTSPQERDWVHRNFRGSFWTGLNDRKAESVFRWTTEEPLSREMAPYLRDDLADGGLKDCVWFEAATGLLRDAPCEEERPFLCKRSEATDWFEERPGRSVAGLGEPQRLYPSAASLAQAKRECLQERRVCLAVLQTGLGFYLISSLEGTAPEAESTLFVRTLCAEGFGGPDCRATSAHPPRPACDCTGKFQTTAEKVCGVPVQTCVDDCRRATSWSNCSLCLPACTEASLSGLDPEELALITMIQFKVSHSLNLTEEDERDQRKSSKIIYDAKYP
ncbi:uncharacterized protein LOC110087453 [Pogona vitticeps]